MSASPATVTRFEVREVFSPDGTISQLRVPITRRPPAVSAGLALSRVTPLQRRGPVDTKFDIVLVGDGYTSAQSALFHRHARSKVAELFSVEPFRSYRDLFNVWLVDVVSRQSGVDNDPSLGVQRDTALGMGFWCGGTERLLCVNEEKAKEAAFAAPDFDQVLALANSTKYGGAGGGVATASGGNWKSGQVAIHELGHSIGGLADEYDSAYIGAVGVVEPEEPNATLFREEAMEAVVTKWHRWLGRPTPDGGVIGTYLGARYNPVLYYRPSENSIMRSLGRAYNLIGREAMVLGFYKAADPISSATSVSKVLTRTARITVVPARPVGMPLRISWAVDGKPVVTRPANAPTLDLAKLKLAPGRTYRITVTVVDATAWVIDAAARAEWMKQTLTWTAR